MKRNEIEAYAEQIEREVRSEIDLVQLNDEQVREEVAKYVKTRLAGKRVTISETIEISGMVFSAIRGFGVLDSIMANDDITEVMINGPKNIFVEERGRIRKLDAVFEDDRHLRNTVQKIISAAGRQVDDANPIADTRLPDGSRVNIVLNPVSLDGTAVTIRKFSKEPMTVEKLIRYGSITSDIASLLELFVRARYNIFICGGTGSGKTTFLNALSNYVPKDERIITIEDSAELQIKGISNLIRLETRNTTAGNAKPITIRDLIISSLRMRPDRIIVGEVRGGEALDMLQAMNTGHDGSLSTGHANSCRDMLSRLETMVIQGSEGLPLVAIRQQISSAIDIMIHLSRLRDRSRKTMEIVEVLGLDSAGNVQLNPLFRFEEDKNSTLTSVSGKLKRTANKMQNTNKFSLAGIPLPSILEVNE